MPENWDEKHLSHSNESQKPDSVPATARDHAISSRGIPFGSGLGKYRILDRVRTSHHAIVYNARDAMLDRLVVIKQLNPGLLDDPLACGDFKREAQLLARVPKDARNVIGIHELIGEDQGLFIVEEFVSGDWLEMLISKRKVGLADALRLLKYGCLGMRSLHSRKIVHRDMQPTSLLLSDNGQLRIGNFACAIHEGDHTPPPIIQTKYAAPELQMGMPHDDRVDIYSLGMTVFEVCVGRKTLHAHFSAITSDVQASVERWRQWHVDMSAMLPNARVLNPAVPPALASILHKMTTKDLDERYASAEEVLQDIIRKFNAPRANVTPALPQASPWQFVAEAAPGLPNVSAQPKAHSSVAKQSSLMHLVKTEKTTTTHSVQPEAQAIVAKEPVRKSEPQKPAPTPAHPRSTAPRTPPTPTPTITPAHPTRAARPRSVTTRVASISAPISVPAHTPVVEPLRKQRRIFLPTAAAILLAASIWAGGSFWWTQSGKRPALKSVESMIEAGMALYRAGDFQKARETFLKVIVTANDNPQLAAEWNRADTMQLLVDGQLALQRNEFDKVEIALSEASMRGADVSALASLKSHFHAKRDALRLSAEGVKAVEAGQFIDAEAKITDYEQNAKYAGLDPDTLKTKLYQEREKREYDHALERARKALAEDDFDGATIALRDAQVIRNSTATRRLQQEIFDAKSRHDWMVRGDKAMNEKDFAAAESAYQSANAIDPTDEIEQKLNMASSMRLYNEAGDEIRAGNLLNARKKLENALWKYANKAARAKLTALTKAFEAAQLVERGDQELSRKNFEEAIRLYEKAIPDLIAPADEMAKAKLNEARQQKSQSTKG